MIVPWHAAPRNVEEQGQGSNNERILWASEYPRISGIPGIYEMSAPGGFCFYLDRSPVQVLWQVSRGKYSCRCGMSLRTEAAVHCFPCHRLNSKWIQRRFWGEHAVRWCVSLPGDFISPSQGCHNFRPNNQSRNMSSIVTVFSAAIPSTVFSFEWSITPVVVTTTTRV